MTTAVHFEKVTVGKGLQVRVTAPFAGKEAIKSTGCATWHAKRKMWTVPFTALAVQSTQDALARVLPGVVASFDEACEPLSRAPTIVTQVEMGPVRGTLMEPWGHQRVGVHMIGQLGGCMLAWDMGSGKTKTVYDAIIHYGFERTLVCCPSTVVSVWGREAKKHAPKDLNLRVLLLDGSMSVDRRAKLLLDTAGECRMIGVPLLVAINYEAAWRTSMGKAIPSLDWDLVVADESHRISNASTLIGRFMSKELASRAQHRVCLSGTPMGKGPEDAFGQFLFAEPALFGTSITRFRSKYCVMGGFENREVVDYQNLDDFKARMNLITTKVKLADVVDLPEYMDEELVVELNGEARRVYNELRDDFIAEHAQGVVTAANAVAKLLRLQQVTSGFAAVTTGDDGATREIDLDSAKADVLKEIMGDIARDEPMVVFCRFRHDIATVHRIAMEAKRASYEISGGGNQQVAWEQDCDLGLGPVIAVQIQAGGVGIDLTKARYCVYYSIGFNLTDYLQSRARVHRPGQTRGVIYYHLIAQGTVDRVVYGALRGKQKVVDAVIESLTGAKELA